jgi:predicted RNA-binding Zn ribbon-like protein
MHTSERHRLELAPAISVPEPFFIGDHPALDFLNTVAAPHGEPIEWLRNDEAVLKWLQRAGLLPDVGITIKPLPSGALTEKALELREAGRRMVAQRKKGKSAPVALLNEILARGHGHFKVTWSEKQSPSLILHRPTKDAADFLVPLAEAMADLLVSGDFELIQRCENCTLWFYDRTKGHQRRWCSMSLCGNRMKVAAFRSRQRKSRAGSNRKAR